MFVINLWQVCGFLRVISIIFTAKTDRHDITEILLKVVLNTIGPLIILVGCFSTSLPLWYMFTIQGVVLGFLPFSVYMIRPEHKVNTPLEGWYPSAKKSSFLSSCISILASNTLF
jgi:hypothetical protein